MTWHVACSLNDIDHGQLKKVRLGGVDVLLVGRERGVAAVPPMCPHMEEPLEKGTCDGKVLTCMKHLWQWNVDNGEPVGLAEAPLKMYRTKVKDDKIYVFVEDELIYERNG